MHAPGLVEFKYNFNPFKAVLIADQNLATGVKRLTLFVGFQAWLVINIHLSVDDFSAAIAFNREWIEFAGAAGRRKQFFEETHGGLLV
jgi:hypothetical protein